MSLSRRAKRLILGFFFLGIAVTFILVASARVASEMKERRRYEEEKAAMKVPAPNTFRVEARSHPQVRRYSATLQPWVEAMVPAEIAGRIEETFVEAGSPVQKGAPLVQLDESLAKIAVQTAQARHIEAMRLYAEAERLAGKNVVSLTQREAVAAEARISSAILAEVNERLAKHTPRAPFDGIVNQRLVSVGDAVHANDPVAEVVDLSRLRVIFFVSEEDLPAFEPGRELELRATARPQEVFRPKIAFVSRSADPRTRLFRVEAELPNEEHQLSGGLQGTVDAEIRRFENCPFIPATAVRFSGRKAIVLKAEGESGFHPAEIEVGPELDGYYPVLSGLNAGETILIR